MAEIFELKARPRLFRNAEPVPASEARILFFTGVRYERIESAADAPTSPAGRGKKPSNPRPRRRRA
ncbi:MAG: hypothetical protein U1E28_03585 [Beijerinckiaceae bacterium]